MLGVGSCARVGSPVGGPRDTIPPILIKAEPAIGTTAFKGKRVRLYFDEFPAIKDQDKELLISPPLQKRVGMTVKGKSVIVDFRDDSLLRNTTYRLMFGKSIVDNNENNPLVNLNYVFSTGNRLDTLMLRGALYDAQTAMPLAGAMALAYETTSDSTILFGKPDKVAKTDSSGVFSLYNLKAKPYRVVVVEDLNNNYRYDVGAERIGLVLSLCNPVPPRPEPVYAHPETSKSAADASKKKSPHKHDHTAETAKPGVHEMPALDIELISAFKEANTKQFILGVERNERRAIKMMFNAPNPVIDSLQLLPLKTFDYTVQANAQKDTIIYWLNNPKQDIPDSLVLKMNYMRTDTANRLVPIRYKTELVFRNVVAKDSKKDKKGGLTGFLKGLTGADTVKVNTDSIRRAERFGATPRFAGALPLLPPVGLGMQFPAPLISMDTSKIHLYNVKINPKTKDTSLIEMKYRLIPIPQKAGGYKVDASWESDASYMIQADTAVFHDIYGKTNARITEKFSTPNPDKMSSISVRLSGTKESTHYVVYLMNDNGGIVRQHSSSGEAFSFSFLAPGKYKLRILEDANGNGIQDMGNFSKKLLPERMTNVGGIGAEALINLREGWDVEQAIKLNELFK